MREYNLVTACNGDIVVDEHGVEFEIFLSAVGALKRTPILAVCAPQGIYVWLNLEGDYLTSPTMRTFGTVGQIKRMKFFHKPVKKTGWVVIFELNKVRPLCKSKVFGSEAEAKNYAKTCQQNVLGVSEVTWEE